MDTPSHDLLKGTSDICEKKWLPIKRQKCNQFTVLLVNHLKLEKYFTNFQTSVPFVSPSHSASNTVSPILIRQELEDGAICLLIIPSKIVLSYLSLKFWSVLSHLCLKSAAAGLHMIRLIIKWYGALGRKGLMEYFRVWVINYC